MFGVSSSTSFRLPVCTALRASPYNSGIGLALGGNGHLFLADNYGGAGGNVIGEYTTSGELLNASFITGLNNPVAILVVPEPSSSILVLLGLLGLMCKSSFLHFKPNQ